MGVGPTVEGELVPPVRDLAYQVRLGLGHLPHHEEGAGDAALVEEVQGVGPGGKTRRATATTGLGSSRR